MNVVLALSGSTQLTKHADVRVVGRQVRSKAHSALQRDRGARCTVDREATEGAYSQLPAWSHRDQWLYLVHLAIAVWFPEQIHRQVRVATLLKFAALVAAFADDETGRNCRRVYPELARDMGVSVETVRKCWRALERIGLAVQVERSVIFSYNERMRIWRLERSKQRGMTPEYALVVPAAYAQAMTTGEHPADLLARDAGVTATYVGTAQTLTPHQKLVTALSKLRSTMLPPATAKAPEAPAATTPPLSPAPSQSKAVDRPVDKPRTHPFGKLGNVDILGLPRSGSRCTFSTCIALVDLVPHGVKSTASRAHNRGDRCAASVAGGIAPLSGAQKRRTSRGGWFGAHRDIAVHLTRRVLWLRGVQPGRIAMQLKRFTVPGLPKVWRPEDVVKAIDAINRRQNRYSPGANLASKAEDDQSRAKSAAAGAVRSPQALLKWYLEQLDPANDHPRFELDAIEQEIKTSWRARREAVAAENAAIAAAGRPLDAPDRAATTAAWATRVRRAAGLPPKASPRNRRP